GLNQLAHLHRTPPRDATVRPLRRITPARLRQEQSARSNRIRAQTNGNSMLARDSRHPRQTARALRAEIVPAALAMALPRPRGLANALLRRSARPTHRADGCWLRSQ